MKKIFFFIIMIIFVPYILITFCYVKKELKYGYSNNKNIKVKLNNNIIRIPLEEYVIGVVAGEMPITFNLEALKAQAVASRTYALRQSLKNKEYDVDDTTSYQVYLTNDKLKDKWKEDYYKNYDIVKKAVMETKGEVILYDNEIIDSLFFSTSNGKTENSSDVFVSDLPYLKSVSSYWDKIESPVYNTEKKIDKRKVLNILSINSNNILIGSINKRENGFVENVIINNISFTGKEIKNKLDLRSLYFDIKEDGDYLIFSMCGYGHNVGMSQYGANGMAKEGKNYNQILSHYYTDTYIKKIY